MRDEGDGKLSRRGFTWPSGLEWLCILAGTALVARYRWLFDDAFVYFRYVDNWLFLDAGLTYNVGEFVEGYSSPAHCLALAALRSFGLPYPTLVLAWGLALFLLFGFLLVQLRGRLAPAPGAGAALNLPLAFLALNYSVTSFFTGGNEGALLHVAAAGTALFLLSPRSVPGALLVGALPLIRPELLLATLVVIVHLRVRQGRFPWRVIGALLALNGAWLGFRVHFYADLLPNTFYLKTGTRMESGTPLEAGLHYLWNAVSSSYGLPLFGVVLLLGGLSLRRSIRHSGWRTAREDLALSPRAGMLSAAGLVAAAVVLSGGSAMHYYYLAFPLTLAVCALGGLTEAFLRSWCPGTGGAVRAVLFSMCALVSVAGYPAILTHHPLTGKERLAELPSVTRMNDPAFFRHQEPIEDPWPSIEELRALGPKLRDSGYTEWTDVGWCNTIYAHPEVRAVHGLGLTDAILARIDTPEATRGHKPALPALARDLIEIQTRAERVDRGVYTSVIDAGRAPQWMRSHREQIDLLERKMFNRHDFVENVGLALRFPGKIRIE